MQQMLAYSDCRDYRAGARAGEGVTHTPGTDEGCGGGGTTPKAIAGLTDEGKDSQRSSAATGSINEAMAAAGYISMDEKV